MDLILKKEPNKKKSIISISGKRPKSVPTKRKRHKNFKSEEKTRSKTENHEINDLSANVCAQEIVNEIWNTAWGICADRFAYLSRGDTLSLELRNTWLRILECQWLDDILDNSRRARISVEESEMVPTELFVADRPPLPVSHDSWSRGYLQELPANRRESFLDPFIRTASFYKPDPETASLKKVKSVSKLKGTATKTTSETKELVTIVDKQKKNSKSDKKKGHSKKVKGKKSSKQAKKSSRKIDKQGSFQEDEYTTDESD